MYYASEDKEDCPRATLDLGGSVIVGVVLSDSMHENFKTKWKFERKKIAQRENRTHAPGVMSPSALPTKLVGLDKSWEKILNDTL